LTSARRFPCYSNAGFRLRSLATVLVLAAATFPSNCFAKRAEVWTEITSPHFHVVGQCKEKRARQIAAQFEEIRTVFHTIFPSMIVTPPAPVYIILVRDKEAFNKISPKQWTGRGEMERAGYFMNGSVRNYLVIRLDAEQEDQGTILYHEYTHLLLHLNMPHIPLWIDEGLADFFGNTAIRQKDVMMGEPDGEYIATLRRGGIIPLQTLFAVDSSSPYYNQAGKGTLFYAESWALVHYLMIQDRLNHQPRINTFMSLVAQGKSPDETAPQAFGNLADLQADLVHYIGKYSFMALKLRLRLHVDASAFASRVCPSERVEAIRADILLQNERYAAARSILEKLLKDDPNDLMAKESLGYLEFDQKHYDAAEPLFAEAIAHKNASYMTHYLYAFLCFRNGQARSNAPIIESNLKAAIQSAPRYAPPYALLAALYGFEGVKLDEARHLGIIAVELDPRRVDYRLTVASVLVRMRQFENAERVARQALAMAKTANDRQLAADAIDRIRQIRSGAPPLANPNP
jgi:tetratricopeptide (TPR) repeat protein